MKALLLPLALCVGFGSGAVGQTLLTQNGDFEGTFRSAGSTTANSNEELNGPTIWNFDDRTPLIDTGSNKYAGSSDSGNNSGVSFFIDVSGANSVSDDLTLQFDVLNDTGTARNFGYELQFYNGDADGQMITGGTAVDPTSGRTAYSFAGSAPVRVAQGSFSVGANTSSFSSSGSIAIPYGTPASWADGGFPGTFSFGSGGGSSTTIDDYTDITVLYLTISWDTSDLDNATFQDVGIDNVNLSSVPEPSAALLVPGGLALLGFFASRRRLRVSKA